MNFLISVLTIIAISFAIQIIFKRTFAESISVAVCSVIMLLYIFTLFIPLTYSAYIACIAGIISLIYVIVSLIKNIHNIKLKTFISIPFILFMICCTFIYFGFSKRVASSWDEFSHWMLVVKNMYYFKNFGIGEYTTTCFPGYPPATGLFECFFSIFSSQFIEGNAYIGFNILLLSLLISPLKNNKLYPSQKIINFFIFLSIPMIFYAPYTSLYVDCILAIMFARLIYIYFSEEKYDFFFFYNFCISASVLILTKASGTGLYLFAIITLLMDMLILDKKTLSLNNNLLILNSRNLISIIMIPLSAKLSWSLYLKIYNFREAWDTSNLSISNFINLFRNNIQEYQKITIKNFIDSFFAINEFGNIGFKSSYFLFPIIFTVTMTIMASWGENRKRAICLNYTLLFSYLSYTASLLILYIFTYSEREAQNVASFARYMNTMTLGYLLVIIMCLCEPSIIHQNSVKENYNNIISINSINIIVLIITLFLTGINVKNHILLSAFNARQTQRTRENYSYMNTLSDMFDYKTDKIYYIEQGGNGLNFCIFRYILTPISINPGSAWSLAVEPDSEDLFTQKMTVKQWADDLRTNYTYVYLDVINDQFRNDYGILFDTLDNIIEKSLYKVTYLEQDDLVKLVLY